MQTECQFSDRWSLSSWFTGLGQPDYSCFKAELIDEAEELKKQLFALKNDLAAFAHCINRYEAFWVHFGHLAAYLGCLSADNANDEAAKAEEAWLATLEAQLHKLRALLQMKLAELEEALFEQLLQDISLSKAEYAISRMRQQGKRQMSSEMESLAAELNVNGLHAWGRLYETLTGKMQFMMTFPDGHQELVPMSRRRALMAEADRNIRKAAFEEGQKPWLEHALTLAAALNGIAGTRLSLYNFRSIGHFLDTPLFEAAMSQASLEAMLAAIDDEIELPRRALRKAASLQGTKALHYFDLEAPQVAAPQEQQLTWDKAYSLVDQAFTSAYPRLGRYLRDMVAMKWVEAQPRPGKRPGAFCTGSLLKSEERVYMSYHGTIHDVVTLAHEVGHAWHSYVLRPERPFAAGYPMTLAETASNFGEMILLNGLMSDANITEETKAYLIDQEMLRAHAYLINIPMRYEFEKAFYNERMAGEVTVSRLSELMEEAQLKLYGDTLAKEGTDPFFWASKMHFFISNLSFYNFPYVFGYLLSQALFARFKEEGLHFLTVYEQFLAMTGSASCEEVVKQTLGEDITEVDFWKRALKAIEPALLLYEAIPSPLTQSI